MFIDFLYELRRHKVPVGAQEAMALAEALTHGLHHSSLEGFYDIARLLLVHDEKHLDAFDQAFAKHFHGVEALGDRLTQELLEWLAEARRRRPMLTPEERELLERFDREELEALFKKRLEEQQERHDGGNKWIGTGGTSPFGNSGRAARQGIRVGGQGGLRSAVRVASERAYAGYRDDLVLDVRQLGIALRKLRALSRDGRAEELDLDQTIHQTARNLGELEVALRPERKSNTRVIMLMDVGGTMDPYAALVSRLFTAAKKATHFKELRTYYFHNCVYGRLYREATFRDPITVSQLMKEADRRYKLIIVGDALMGPWELHSRSGWEVEDEGVNGLTWLHRLAEHYPHAVWLNPEPTTAWWHETIDVIRRVFSMYPLTVEGLTLAVQHLTRAR